MIRRPMDTDLKIRMSPPLGLLTVAALLRNENEIQIVNENICDDFIDEKKLPDIVGLSVTVDVLPRAREIAKKYMELGVTVVAGGIHITTAWQTVDEKSFSVFCVGAAEKTWPQVVEDFKNHSLKKIYFCPKDFSGDDIVSPAYDLINSDEYLYCNIVHTSRGCPFKCDFCYNSSGAHNYVNRKIDDVIADIKTVGRKHIMFIDDNFFGNRKWLEDFLEKIKPMHIKWNAAASLNVAFDTKLLDKMKDCGLQGLFIGFESISETSIENVHKIQNSVARYEEAIKNLHDRGIMINASFVFGLDSDTKETFKKTLDWIVKNKIETVTSHILTPYPGTKLYEDFKNSGRITSENLSLYNTANVVFEPKQISPEDLKKGYLWIYKKIYSWKNIFRRIPKSKDQRAAYFMFNIFYRKYGKLTDFLCRIFTYKRVGYFFEKLAIAMDKMD